MGILTSFSANGTISNTLASRQARNPSFRSQEPNPRKGIGLERNALPAAGGHSFHSLKAYGHPGRTKGDENWGGAANPPRFSHLSWIDGANAQADMGKLLLCSNFFVD